MVHIIRFKSSPIPLADFKPSTLIGTTVEVNPDEYIVILKVKPLLNLGKTHAVGYSILSYTDTVKPVYESKSIYKFQDNFTFDENKSILKSM